MPKDDFSPIKPDENNDIIEFVNDIIEEKYFAFEIKFYYQFNTRQKQLIKITKIPDQYAVAMNKDILVQFNPDYYNHFSLDEEGETIKAILISQEIDRIETNGEKMTLKLNKPSIATTKGTVDKYSYDNVQRAIVTEKMFEPPKKEK
jgi:hypothetical protein